MNEENPVEAGKAYRREIRSFVIRDGRITPGQIRALEEYWPLYGIDVGEAPLGEDLPFLTEKPVVLEIGFGMGDSLFEMAQQAPGSNFIGVEVHRPGVGHLLDLFTTKNWKMSGFSEQIQSMCWARQCQIIP